MSNNYVSNKILISLLKQYGIKKLVLSSGCRHVPFVSSVEIDKDFDCYSIIDERNAAFFGMGLSEESNEAVAIACTSGTAASNYVTGVTEAYYSNVPLVILTFDRNPYMYNQLETQKIDQVSIFKSITKKSVTLPVIKDEEDVWYCERLINEALINLNRHGKGPVHINVPLVGNTNDLYNDGFAEDKFDNIKKINYLDLKDESLWKDKVEELGKTKKILLVIGQHSYIDDNTKKSIRAFVEITKCPVLCDNLSNFKCNNNILAGPIIKALNSKTMAKFAPEIVISFGNNMQERIKDLLRGKNIKHWYITPDGEIRDCFKAISAVFECSTLEFFNKINKDIKNIKFDDNYYKEWKKISSAIKIPDMPFTNFYVTREFSKLIPNDSLLHLSILNATRQMQFFDLDESIRVFSNVNAFGIDGCLPTFMGQACNSKKLSFIVIGDLSFFYGMNALAIKHRNKNIRVLMINNGGGAEFHIQPDSNSIPTIDMHIGASHNRTAKDWANSLGYKYLSANNKDEFDNNIKEFVKEDSDSPIFFEVFTNMKTDGEFTLSVYREMEKSIKDLL